jgi:opacity protein-like surface antigen
VQLLGGGGLAVPVAPKELTDGWKEGYDIAGGVGVRLTNHVSIRGLIGYDRFRFDDVGVMSLLRDELGFHPADVGASVDFAGGDTTFLSISGEVKFSFVGDTSRFSPYVFGGGGATRVEIDDLRVTLDAPFVGPIEDTIEGTNDTKGMATVGGGVDIPASESFAIFVEGRYQLTFLDEERGGNAVIRAGVQLGF